jgi:hypothetical protein
MGLLNPNDIVHMPVLVPFRYGVTTPYQQEARVSQTVGPGSTGFV